MAVKKVKGNEYIDIGMQSGEIKNLLAEKYADAVFVGECKDGQTWTSHSLRLDAWVLLRTYTPWTTIGFEIKIDRQDFERDKKWMDYMPLCHLFYFVCPAGLIRPQDLPPGVGLMWVSTTKHLHIKIPAGRHEPDEKLLRRLMTYIVMSRSVIVSDMYKANAKEDDAALTPFERRKKDILYEIQFCEERKELASIVQGYVRRKFEEIKTKEYKLADQERSVKRFSEALTHLGITWDPEKSEWQDVSRVEIEINDLKKTFDSYFLTEVERMGNSILDFATRVRKERNRLENRQEPFLNDPSIHHFTKQIVRDALNHDPVDAIADIELALNVLKKNRGEITL